MTIPKGIIACGIFGCFSNRSSQCFNVMVRESIHHFFHAFAFLCSLKINCPYQLYLSTAVYLSTKTTILEMEVQNVLFQKDYSWSYSWGWICRKMAHNKLHLTWSCWDTMLNSTNTCHLFSHSCRVQICFSFFGNDL